MIDIGRLTRTAATLLCLSISARVVAQNTVPVAQASTPAVSASKKSDPVQLGGKWYSTVELRHHINTYYNEQGGYGHQEPSLHARLQFGAQFYDGIVDAYATLGVFKEPTSQQVLQRRPELDLDYYPWKNDFATILIYNMVQLPVRAANSGATVEDEKDDYSASSVYMMGLAPTLKYPLIKGASRLDLKAGVDGWTRLYSRKQYTTSYSDADKEDEADDGRLGLNAAADGAAPIEDYALHYQAQALAGVAFSPEFAHALNVETTAHYHSKFEPRYTREPSGNVDYVYGVERYAYYRIRLHYDLSDRVAVTNDFYHFHEGFFAENRKGIERRYRNILRLSCRL